MSSNNCLKRTPEPEIDDENEKRSSCAKGTGTELILNKIPHAFRDLLCVKEDNTSPAEEMQPHHTHHNALNRDDDDDDKKKILNRLDQDFQQAFHPSQMRCLALVSHNEMKATMKKFVLANKTILKKFRLTGTNSTMTMLHEVFKGDDSVIFGPSCSSGPLGGDAELVALMCADQLGGVIFFQDPMSAHPHQSDIDCLCRQAVVHNTMIASNPTSALMMMTTLRCALKEDMPELIPSFFFTLQSPSVRAYMKEQNKVIASHSSSTPNLQEEVAGDRDDEPSVAHRVVNDVDVPAPAGSSTTSSSPRIEFENLPCAVPHSVSVSDTTTRSISYSALETIASYSAGHDDDDSESVNSIRSRASHLRRLEAQTKLVQSFTVFVESMGGQITAQPSRSTRFTFTEDESSVINKSTTGTLTRKPRSFLKIPLLCR
eukprot:CAMPEP_0198283130 /NCGR_PEP_ID=MMETSP1449-20131203/2807_1 /TAXON_ID=420275 /ORGANISM="Attheya septentrionalis, Strain CCMP2084" /LENGTH=429 /DNA_ID=CAMNT_0043979645 /DNA_START=80 /DNA_END=1369 /DNA_ORIENTATION=-